MCGRVYRLVDRQFFDNNMDMSTSSEILRCPLDMGTPPAIFALERVPPNLDDIRNTILLLKEVGALLRTVKGNYDQLDGDMTYLGRIAAADGYSHLEADHSGAHL